MKPVVVLAEAWLANRRKLSLRRHDGHYHIRVGSELLMSTAATASEARMAELAHASSGPRPAPRVLIGGLGLGFTLRRLLELASPQARVEVAEFLPQVVEWNRAHLAEVNGRLLDDPRVDVRIADVLAVLRAAPRASYDAVLLDVDNGPQALVAAGNERLYADEGLRVLLRALKPGGRAVLWAAGTDERFLRPLRRAGFEARALRSKAYPAARVSAHTLYVADRPPGGA